MGCKLLFWHMSRLEIEDLFLTQYDLLQMEPGLFCDLSLKREKLGEDLSLEV